MKTEFELDEYKRAKGEMTGGSIYIIGKLPKWKPYIAIKVYHKNAEGKVDHRGLFIKDKDIEKFAVNILKSIGSKKLKT
jgi:hypothetical protein